MGFFITFEGIEGCGKSTQLELLKAHLEKKGRAVFSVREPGGTLLGERVRSVLLNGTEEGIDPWAELFLYEACRAQLVAKVIRPALAQGKVVLCDRFFDSTLAYQGFGRGLDVEKIEGLNALATGGLVPDLTFLVDCAEEVGLKRAWARINASMGAREDRFEKEELAFHRRVRDGFLEIARAAPRVKVVDGSREISTVHGEIRDIIEGVAGL
ncbi:MAG: dTMP kinase [Deltaproteobacteria bacterium GWA2_54_12]|nr:MAG: dTMP kinase [Deltaproteobacteria bacterium GWA2_54_12]